MSLLADLVPDSPDPAYAAAATRRPGAVRPDARHVAVLVGPLLLLGLLVGVAVGQTRQRAPAVAEARRALLADVRARAAGNDALQRRVAELRLTLARARDESLAAASAGARLREQLAALERVSGAVPVAGPGVRVVLDDAPAGRRSPPTARPGTGAVDPGRVVDRDLQAVVNALWAAGAEAVAINGQRLTTLSAIREAGDAILVDFRPLSPPYRVVAIGDPDGLGTRFADSVAGRRFGTYAATYGLRFDIQPQAALRLPAAGTVSLRRARPLPREGK